MGTVTPETQRRIAEVDRLLADNKLFQYVPYPKQLEFHAAGGKEGVKERLLIAGSQLGKTLSASREVAMHATGLYPDWWPGAKFLRPTAGWAASNTSQGTRDTVQRMLLGPPGEWGTGAIPKKSIVDVKKATHGVADAVEIITVRHTTNGVSRITLKTYDQGRERWQGDTLNWLWCVAEGERVQMSDGRYIPIERVRVGDSVLTTDGRGQRVSRKVLATHDRGVRPVVEVAMARGPWLRLTPDHEVYTNTRTKKPVGEAAKILQVPGEWEPEGAATDLSDAYFAWAGLVISEGSVSCKKITMAENPAVLSAVAMLPAGARVRRHVFAEKHNHVPDWFLSWGDFWSRIPSGLAHEKQAPEWVFTAPNEKVAVFLSYLYAGDGWASGHVVGYASTSRVLAEQVSTLLWRFGVRSGIFRVPKKNADWREQWHVIISSSNAVLAFAEKVGIPGKEDALSRVCAEAQRRMTSKRGRGAHFKGRRLEGTPDELLAYRAAGNTRTKNRFARVRGIRPDGEARVFDLTIEGEHRFVVGTAVVSNCDEEAPLDIYIEGLTRTNATGGIVFTTFTPLLGMSDVVRRFLIAKEAGTHVTKMTIEDALHYTPAERARVIAAYPLHERDARAKGIPILGSGRIFPIEESAVSEAPLQIPQHWPRIAGIDFGYDHPTAIVWVAWDRDTDTMHVYDCYKRKEASPAMHSVVLRSRGTWIPVAWPHDGLQHDKGGSCTTLAQQYRDMGANMLRDHATHAPVRGQKEGDGGYGLEAGLMEMFDRMQTGRLKVAKHLTDWWDEFRLYHRKDGKVVKEADDLMSATRIAMMMLRKSVVFQQPKTIVVPGYRPTVPGMGMMG